MKFRLRDLAVACSVVILLAVFALFGVQGVASLLLVFLFFLLPFYLLLGFFGFDFYERVFFGFFVGIAFFPLLLWFVDRVLGSLLVSAVVVAVVLLVSGLYLNGKGKRND